MNDAALLDSLHAALRNPDLAWYTEFHAGESIVAGYLDSLTDPYDDDAIQVPEGWFRYSVVTREGPAPDGRLPFRQLHLARTGTPRPRGRPDRPHGTKPVRTL